MSLEETNREIAFAAMASMRFSNEVTIGLRPNIPQDELNVVVASIVRLAQAGGLRVTFAPKGGWGSGGAVDAIIHRAPTDSQPQQPVGK